jgi:hypothetical protein
MNHDIVVAAWRSPVSISTGTSADGVVEQWVYQRSHCKSTTYAPHFYCWNVDSADVYFENGLVTSIQQLN